MKLSYKYQFPKYSKTTPSIREQVTKVNFETAEVVEVSLKLPIDIKELIQETFDVIHSCETLLRRIDDVYPDVNLEKEYCEVLTKNKERNYYGKDKESARQSCKE